VTITMKIGSVFSQIEVELGRSGRARLGRRERRGPLPSLGGGTRGRTIRSGLGAEVEDEREMSCEIGIDGASRRCCERRIECRIDGGRAWSCLSPQGAVRSFFVLMVT